MGSARVTDYGRMGKGMPLKYRFTLDLKAVGLYVGGTLVTPALGSSANGLTHYRYFSQANSSSVRRRSVVILTNSQRDGGINKTKYVNWSTKKN